MQKCREFFFPLLNVVNYIIIRLHLSSFYLLIPVEFVSELL